MDGVVTTAYNIAGEQIEGATLSDIKKDQQIFIHYGNRNNANLLVHNGYAWTHTQFNAILPKIEQLLKFRCFLCNQINLILLCVPKKKEKKDRKTI